MRLFFTATALLTGALGLIWVFLPEQMLTLSSGEVHTSAVYMARRYGALFWGYAAILWSSRSLTNNPSLKPILYGLLVVSVVISLVSLYGAITRQVTEIIWGVFIVELVLAAGSGYFLMKKGG